MKCKFCSGPSATLILHEAFVNEQVSIVGFWGGHKEQKRDSWSATVFCLCWTGLDCKCQTDIILVYETKKPCWHSEFGLKIASRMIFWMLNANVCKLRRKQLLLCSPVSILDLLSMLLKMFKKLRTISGKIFHKFRLIYVIVGLVCLGPWVISFEEWFNTCRG